MKSEQWGRMKGINSQPHNLVNNIKDLNKDWRTARKSKLLWKVEEFPSDATLANISHPSSEENSIPVHKG